MKIDILTLFPAMFAAISDESLIGRANDRGIADINLVDIRDYTLDKHNRVDDTPFGGGVGMLMQAEPIFRALRGIDAEQKKIIYPSPKGKILNVDKVRELSNEEELVILCGHYEGIDERVIESWEVEEISIGDYILTGGEPAAIVIVDSVVRMLPEVLGKEESIEEESIYSGLLEHPQYTKPRSFEGRNVPEVLLSGHHKNIALWKYEQSLLITAERRPDLFNEYLKKDKKLSKEEKMILEKVIKHCKI